jgi:ABC-type transport system involved in multi-copper enzyme maturation permease subunit
VALAINPIIVKELRSRMRGSRTFVILSIFLLGLAAMCYAILRVYESQAKVGNFVISAHVGKGLFAALTLAETLLITFLAPAVTAGAISGEREQLTYDLLVATPLRPGRILSGKLVATLSYILLLIFAAVPLGSLVLVFGGVAPRDLLEALLLLVLTAFTFGMIGLLCSTLVRRTLTATILAYAIVLLLVVGSYFIVALRIAAQPNQPPASSRIVAFSPFSAMVSIVARGGQAPGGRGDIAVAMPAMGGGGPAIDVLGPIMSIPGFGSLMTGVVEYGPNGQVVLPIYRWTFVIYSLLGIGCYWFASHLVRPRRRWRFDLHDLLIFATFAGVAGFGVYWLGLWPSIAGKLGL